MGSSNGELIQQITDSFNESQDKIFVKAVHQGSYTDAGTKMQAALAAGEAPVFSSDGDWYVRNFSLTQIS